MVEKEKQVPFFTIRAVLYKILFLQIRRQKHFFLKTTVVSLGSQGYSPWFSNEYGTNK